MGTQRGDKVKYGSFKRTSEFDLEIGVCFVENWNLFSKIGICFAKWEGGGGVVFKNVVERFNYCIVKRQFSNSDFLKQIP